MGARQAVFACFVVALVYLTCLFTIVTAESWPTNRILSSVTRIAVEMNGQPGNCTAFSVDHALGQFVTAGHCARGPVLVGSTRLDVIALDEAADIALLQAREGGLPALKLGSQPRTGDATLSVGYPLSSPNPMLVPSMYQGQFDAWSDGNNFAVFSGNPMPGMSGGPIVNTRGEVVSVVLGGGNPSQVYQNVGFGTQYQALRRLVQKWKAND